MNAKPAKRKRENFGFRPAPDVESLISKAATKRGLRHPDGTLCRGAITVILNECVRKAYGHLYGKREANKESANS